MATKKKGKSKKKMAFEQIASMDKRAVSTARRINRNLDMSWKPYKFEAQTNSVVVTGCNTTVFKSGPRKGKTKYLIKHGIMRVVLYDDADPPCSDDRRKIIHQHINDTPHLVSYLWDSGLMPEQLTPNSKAHHFMLGLCWADLHHDRITDMSKHI